jgi:hypothetical protein
MANGMSFVSVTRLRLRSWRFFPAFMAYTLMSGRQVRRADGFLGGYLAGDSERGSWTVTVWRDQASMRAFRNSDAHRRAMPKLLHWCDEASVASFAQSGTAVPVPSAAFDSMRDGGRISKVWRPSERQQQGRVSGASPPQVGMTLRHVLGNGRW